MKKYIFHIDANNAFLSWTAAYRLFLGDICDLRDSVSVIGGDEEKRCGIVLAKSEKAKALGIKTAMPLAQARKIYPNLLIASPNYSLYLYYSDSMINILKEYSYKIEKYSIDECFMEISTDDDPVLLAHKIKSQIKNELGFTVNIGISTNKCLAKMASDFEKPDKVHTLFTNEIESKLWTLQVSKLFMCGRKTSAKLKKLCIYTIKDLANTDIDLLLYHFNSFIYTLHDYANGIDKSPVLYDKNSALKGIGNSTTCQNDISDIESASLYMLALSETVGIRLRKQNSFASVITIELVDSRFKRFSHSQKLDIATNSTQFIYKTAKILLDYLWTDKIKIRKFGLRASNISSKSYLQENLLNDFDFNKQSALDKYIDEIRQKFGDKIIFRACFLASSVPVILGKEENPHKINTKNINSCS